MPFIRGENPKKWRTEAHSEVDFRYFPLYPDVFPEKELGIAFEECSFNIIRDEHYKYVHFTALPPLFFDLKNDPGELNNLADDSTYTNLVLKSAQRMLSWRMSNDERTLTGMVAGPNGITKRSRSR